MRRQQVRGNDLREAAGSMFEAIGVSGGPSGSDDDKCARSGIEAIQDSLEF